MAWDLWSSSYDQVSVVQDGNCSEHTGWQCDFYFGCGYDAIEEDALNERCCIEVLRILIRKEDTELEELGKDLLSLQSELACAEHEKWPELCFNALSEKINWLDVSVRTLKNHHADDSGTQPLLHNKPAESVHEIVKALRRDFCQDACGQELLAKDCVGTPDLRAISCASGSGHSDGMKLSGTSNLQVSGNEEDRRQLVAKDTGQVPNSSFSEGMENAPKEAEITQERHAIVEYDSTYASRVAYGITGREEGLGSIPSDSQPSNSGNDGNSDLDRKLCNFASESEGRVCTKELIVLDEDLDYMKPLRVVYPQELCLPDGELSSLKVENDKNPPQAGNMNNPSLILAKPQTRIIPYSRSRLKDEDKSQARGRKSETYADLSKSNVSLPSKQKNQWKRKSDLDAFSDGEPRDRPIKLRPRASTIVTCRGQQKPSTSIISIDEGCSNESLVRKATEREVQPSQHETGEHAIVPYDSEFSESQKKRKVDAQTSVLQPDKLKDLKLIDLRAIAKQHNVKRYYKLNKGALVELLRERLSSL